MICEGVGQVGRIKKQGGNGRRAYQGQKALQGDGPTETDTEASDFLCTRLHVTRLGWREDLSLFYIVYVGQSC